MQFEPIDLSHWERAEYFTHYLSEIPCTYSMTVRLDITRLKQSGQKLYPAMLYALAKAVNAHPEFRMALDADGKPDMPENSFTVSMLPWASFEGFHLNLQKGYTYLKPIFTIGKYTGQNGRYTLPLAVQVHHAVCDGFHACRLVDDVQATLDSGLF